MSSEDDAHYSSPQPNVPGRGIIAGYGIAFWALVVAIGLVAGIAGALLMLLLHALEHLAWSFHSGTFLDGVRHTSSAHRVLVLLGAGVVAGLGVSAFARLPGFGGREVSDALWRHDGRLALRPSLGRGLLSIVIVALGASLGREAAPQLAGAAFASRLCEKAGIPSWQRRLLVACGAGAGMAAVYNIPLGGALFALEVLLGAITLPLVLPALLSAMTATAVAWLALPNVPTYRIPAVGASAALIAWAAIVGPLAGLAAVAWVRLVAWVDNVRPQGRRRGPGPGPGPGIGLGLGLGLAPIAIFTLLGAMAIRFPELLGNGKDTVQLAITGQLTLATLAALVLLKPIVTAACLGSGAPGGLFTPTLTYGVLLGGLLGHVWTAVWPGTPAGSFALVGGGAVLAASMQAPLAATVMMIELAHHADTLVAPLLLAVTGATVVARQLGAPSIYSARVDEEATPRSPSAIRPGVT